MKYLLWMSLILALMMCSCDKVDQDQPGESDFPVLTGAYLGQEPPGMTPQMFLPTVITEEVHSTTVFSLEGDEVYWTPMEDGMGNMRFMKIENGAWTPPAEFITGNNDHDGEPCFSTDGNRLYFTSWSQPNVSGIVRKENIWYIRRNNGGWDNPVILSNVVNGIDLHWSFSISNRGNLYYGGQPLGEDGHNDIYCAEFENGSFVRRIRMDDRINTPGSEDTPFIAPDESYLIFSRVLDRYADFYITFRNNDGSWGDPFPMDAINSGGHELSPHLSPDGLYLFFMSSRTGRSKPYWVSAQVIEDLRPR